MKTRVCDALVSVVVPVYNVEPYLSDCINSILNQTYSNFELILVDDGSTDKSGEICDEFAAEDKRISVIHIENGGISNARNTGLDQARGEWVMFVDSDDWIENECLAHLISNVDTEMSAVACSLRVCTDGAVEKEIIHKSEKYTGRDSIRTAYSVGALKQSFYGPIGKLYRGDIIKNIRFDKQLAVAEDIVFNVEFLSKSHCVATTDYVGYNIRSNITSTTHKISSKYSPLFEHGYNLISNKIFEARKKLGIPEEELIAAQYKGYPQRYFEEVSNLFKIGSPYNRKERIHKIKEIHKDTKFINEIKKRSFSSLSSAEKVSLICAKIGIPFITYFVFLILLKATRRI